MKQSRYAFGVRWREKEEVYRAIALIQKLILYDITD
jgi:hypothetical protein